MCTREHLTPIIAAPCNLFLDIWNIRFFGEAKLTSFKKDTPINTPRAQETTRRYLLRHQGGQALVDSILQQGFLPIDRLIVREFEAGKYVVIEGNRRLAAVKTILGKTAFKMIRPSEKILASMQSLDALLLKAPPEHMVRSSLLLQGARHISGVRSWGPFQQGKLIHILTQNEGMSIRSAAAAVGMSPSRVSLLLKGYCGLAQMQDNPSFGKKADAHLFSHFEQAYAKQTVREWLGWNDDTLCYHHLPNLEFFYACIMEKRGRPPSLLARHVRDMLPSVLGHPAAKEAFISGRSTIEEAYRLSQEGSEGYTQLARHASELKKLVKRLGLDAAPLDGIGLEAVRQLHQLTASLLMRGTTTG